MATLGLRALQNVTADRITLPDPTEFPPGSAGKIAELKRRLAAGMQLWHPEDDHHVQYRASPSSRLKRVHRQLPSR